MNELMKSASSILSQAEQDARLRTYIQPVPETPTQIADYTLTGAGSVNRFHIDTGNHSLAICESKGDDCPFKESPHFDSEVEAIAGYKKYASNLKETDSYFTNQGRLAREVKIQTNEILFGLEFELNRRANERALRLHEIASDPSLYPDGREPELRAEKINDLCFAGDFEDGTTEWHEFRHAGIGGSDAAKIMSRVSRSYLLAEKAMPFAAEEHPDEKRVASFDPDSMNAAHRGTASEQFIRRLFAEKHPELNIVAVPGSWARADKPYMHANFDGMSLDNDGSPTGIVEIKTGSTGGKTVWGDTADGLNGVPKKYKYQCLWYCRCSGLRKGTLVALIDGYDYREYRFDLDQTPELEVEAAALEGKADEFWAEVENGEVSNPFKFSIGGMSEAAYLNFASSLGAKVDTSNEPKDKAEKRAYRESQIRQGLKEIIDGKQPSPVFYGLDLETNNFRPDQGRILQMSVVRYEIGKTPELIHNLFFGVNALTLGTTGLGATSVHRITEDVLHGAPTWGQQHEKIATILDEMKGGIMVAHSANFEKSWLSLHMDGFKEAIEGGELKILDTMNISKYLQPETGKNTLESFVTSQGIPYEGAHMSDADTLMMMRAFDKWVHIFVSEE